MKHSVFTVLLPDMNLEEVFGLLNELKYDGVELRIQEDYHVPPDKILSRVNDLQDLMTRYRLEIPVLGTYLSIADREILTPVFEAAQILGAKGVRVSLGSPLDSQRSYWKVLDEVSRELEVFIKSIQPFGVKALFENTLQDIDLKPELGVSAPKEF